MSNILLMPFKDQSESFTLGFECGKIWDTMGRNESIENLIVHVANQEQIILMCDHFGYTRECKEVGDDCWMYLTAQPVDISNVLNTEP